MENHLRYFETMAAAERTGLYYTCINSYLTPEEVAYIVDNCDAKVFITSQAKADVAVAAAAMTPKVETFLCVDADREIGPFRPYDAAIAAFPPTPIADEQLGAAMLYSSGHDGAARRGSSARCPTPTRATPLPVMQFIVDHLFRMREGMTYLSPAPIYHSAPQASVACALRLGCDVGDHGALRPRAVPGARRAAPHHPLPGRADDVQPDAQAARRRRASATTCRRWRSSSTPPRRARCR